MKSTKDLIINSIKDLNRFWDLRKVKDLFLLFLLYIDSDKENSVIAVDKTTINYNSDKEIYVGSDPKGVSIVLDKTDKSFFNQEIIDSGGHYKEDSTSEYKRTRLKKDKLSSGIDLDTKSILSVVSNNTTTSVFSQKYNEFSFNKVVKGVPAVSPEDFVVYSQISSTPVAPKVDNLTTSMNGMGEVQCGTSEKDVIINLRSSNKNSFKVSSGDDVYNTSLALNRKDLVIEANSQIDGDTKITVTGKDIVVNKPINGVAAVLDNQLATLAQVKSGADIDNVTIVKNADGKLQVGSGDKSVDLLYNKVGVNPIETIKIGVGPSDKGTSRIDLDADKASVGRELADAISKTTFEKNKITSTVGDAKAKSTFTQNTGNFVFNKVVKGVPAVAPDEFVVLSQMTKTDPAKTDGVSTTLNDKGEIQCGNSKVDVDFNLLGTTKGFKVQTGAGTELTVIDQRQKSIKLEASNGAVSTNLVLSPTGSAFNSQVSGLPAVVDDHFVTLKQLKDAPTKGEQGPPGPKGTGSNDVYRLFTPGGFGFGAEAALRSQKSITHVCNESDMYASIPKNTLFPNNFYTLNMVVSSMGFNGIKTEEVTGEVLPTRVEHTFELFCKDHKMSVEWDDPIDSIVLFKKIYDNPTQARDNNQVLFNNKITILANDKITSNGDKTNNMTIFANCIDSKGEHSSISYHKLRVVNNEGDEDTYINNLEFYIRPVIKYVFADATNAKGLNRTFSSTIYPNAYIVQNI